jgi:hypothetical protein
MTIVANPRAYKIPDWFLNRQKDVKDGRYSQVRRCIGQILPHCLLTRWCAAGMSWLST